MDLLYLAGHDFHGFVWFRPQHIATRLSRKHNVLYVQPARAIKWMKPWRWNRLSRLNEHLHIYEPAVIPGIRYLSFLRRLNQRILGLCIRRKLKKLGMNANVCFIATPFMGEFAGKFGEQATVYDCNDDWSAIPHLPTAFLVNEEKKLAKTADIVFVTSRKLYDKFKLLNENTHILPSGADADHFSCLSGVNKLLPEEIARLPHPIIGSIGSINGTKDDLELLNGIAEARPDWSLVVVGPVMKDAHIEKYTALKEHVLFLGHREYSELPRYVNAFDVCLLAYKRNHFTDSVNPTKVFEYLSAGKPVVATPLDDIRHLEPLITFAEDSDEFVQAIEDCLGNKENAEAQAMRVKAGRRFSWDAVVDELEKRMVEKAAFA